jgi:hypothetical protein
MPTMMDENELKARQSHPLRPTPVEGLSDYLEVNLGPLRISKSALKAVEHEFNPAHSVETAMLKLLTAVLITRCEDLRDRPMAKLPEDPNVRDLPSERLNNGLRIGARRASVAITQYEDACMWAVKANFA